MMNRKDEILVPSSWENEGFHGFNGYAWYRKHFSIPQRYRNRTMHIHLGNIDDVDEVYINGKTYRILGFPFLPTTMETAYIILRTYPDRGVLFSKL
ncbi:MAG: hypothetical protein MZV64_31940 [Ignavibacteriales bacterium]|nr:hypothetical protein [Ignavibacteriales bacterium]